jgi:hypothetical protein
MEFVQIKKKINVNYIIEGNPTIALGHWIYDNTWCKRLVFIHVHWQIYCSFHVIFAFSTVVVIITRTSDDTQIGWHLIKCEKIVRPLIFYACR